MSEMMDENQMMDDFIENEETTKDLYLTFEIDNEDYAIEVINIKEIITMCSITTVPHTPNFLKGIINLRGDIVPVINIRARFNMSEIEIDDLACIIVLDFGDYIIGLIVDQVKGVFTITEDRISSLPESRLRTNNKFIKNIGKTENGIKLIIDVDKFLFAD